MGHHKLSLHESCGDFSLSRAHDVVGLAKSIMAVEQWVLTIMLVWIILVWMHLLLFTTVDDGLSWLIVIEHGQPRPIVVHDGQWWFMVVDSTVINTEKMINSGWSLSHVRRPRIFPVAFGNCHPIDDSLHVDLARFIGRKLWYLHIRKHVCRSVGWL